MTECRCVWCGINDALVYEVLRDIAAMMSSEVMTDARTRAHWRIDRPVVNPAPAVCAAFTRIRKR